LRPSRRRRHRRRAPLRHPLRAVGLRPFPELSRPSRARASVRRTPDDDPAGVAARRVRGHFVGVCPTAC